VSKLVDPIDQISKERFQIAHLAPLQRFVIANILEAAEDQKNSIEPYYQLVLFPTGFGKSICFNYLRSSWEGSP